MNRPEPLTEAGDAHDTWSDITGIDGPNVVVPSLPEPLPYEPSPDQPPIGAPELVYVFR